MPSIDKIEAHIQRVFRKANGRDMDKGHLSHCVMAFRAGYSKGQADFAATHDWYEA